MALSPKMVRSQLALVQPLLKRCSLDTMRKGQSKLGELMEFRSHDRIVVKKHSFSSFEGAWIVPKDERRQGAILYLHGGGYTCGDLEYAKGFGSALASECGLRTLCVAYRLAPENPHPAALEDALEAYRYLLKKGYKPEQIALFGESAGGGLCYALCLKLRELAMPQPGCVIALSPWTDLTLSGDSYEENWKIDPALTRDMLEFHANSYTNDRESPFVSPLLGDLKGLPPSLIFVGSEEILLSDAKDMHKKLLAAGVHSELVITPDRWHVYLLYGFEEDKKDYIVINRFLNRYISQENKLRWMPLDNAAKIYPAAQRKKWSNVFRLSATLREEVDCTVLQSALDVTVRRFPSLCARLRRGVFWYYLEQIHQAPLIRAENSYPVSRMSRQEVRKCAFRVIVYGRRIAVEMFHSLADGTGGTIFLKTLLAEYLQQKYGISVPAGCGVLGRLEDPTPQEMEDSFQKYAGPVNASRKGRKAWHVQGTPEKNDFLHVTCLRLPAHLVAEKARELGVSVTTFLAASLLNALQNLQAEKIQNPMHRNAIRVQLPVNLRRLFPSQSVRNFSMYIMPEIDPRLGNYSFKELCDVVKSRISLEVNPKFMSTMIAANINSERLMALRLVPLVLKNLIMKAVFDSVGERQCTMSLSNLGIMQIPEVMTPYVSRFDFVLSVQATAPYNCGVVTYGDTMCINFIRNIRESELEYHFFKVLQSFDLPVVAESNNGGQ